MDNSQQYDFQNEDYRYEGDIDNIDFEEIPQNYKMRYYNDQENIDLINNRDLDEEDINQNEIQKVSSTLCMRVEQSDESVEESQFQGTQSRTCNSGTLQKSIKRGIGRKENLILIDQRNGKQIREHYMNQLHQGINSKQRWNEEEDELLLNLQQKYGSKWCQINKNFQGRTKAMLKNRFNKLQKENNYIDRFLNIGDEPQQQQLSQ